MVGRKFLIPAKGCQVRKEHDPKLFVKKTGELLPYSIYYRRRVRRGEMIVGESAKEKK